MKFTARPPAIPVFVPLAYLGNHRWALFEFVEIHLGSMMGIPYLYLRGRP